MPIENLNDEEKRQIEVAREADRLRRQDARCEDGKHAKETEKDGKKYCSHCGADITPPPAAEPPKKKRFSAIL